MKVIEWERARQEIQKDVLDVLVRWRGEDKPENNARELEEIWREVIVIDSDEEGDGEDEYEPPEPSAQVQREPSVEYIRAQRPDESGFHDHPAGAGGWELPGEQPQADYRAPPRETRQQAGFRRRIEESMRRHNLIAQQATRRPTSPHPAYVYPDQRGYGYQQQAPERNLDQRPMFISSARPHEAAIVPSIEGGGSRKRKSQPGFSPPLGHHDEAAKRLQLSETEQSAYERYDLTRSPVYRRIDGEDIEIIDLRATHQQSGGYHPGGKPSLGFDGASDAPQYGSYQYHDPHDAHFIHPAQHGSAWYHPSRRQEYIDADTGRSVTMGHEYEVLRPPPPPQVDPFAQYGSRVRTNDYYGS